MKSLLNYTWVLLMVAVISCKNGIDPLTKVDPGADIGAPVITIKKPVDGFKLKVPEAIAKISIDFEVTDDIEIVNVKVAMDGQQIAEFKDFKDYRIFKINGLAYDKVSTGVHTLTITAKDLDGKETVKSVSFEKTPPYLPLYAGEIFYMPFDGDFNEQVSITAPKEVGSPGFAGMSVAGKNAYKGKADSYLTFPTKGLLNSEGISAAFWYKASGSPDRAGILVTGANAERNQGFRLFREGSTTEQTIKLNVGIGTGESWNDGGKIKVNANEWVHIAFTLSKTESIIYLNGEPVNTGKLAGTVDFTGCQTLTIGAGGETFSYWDHKSDNSPMDELRLFNKTLSGKEIQQLVTKSSTTLYMPFNDSFSDAINSDDVTEVGSPGFAAGKNGRAYSGAVNAYLTLPANNLKSTEFSASFWYKVNATPDRAGILVMSPLDAANPTAMNNRTSGFRLLRENAGGKQRIKLNVGNGTADTWVDGGVAADIDPTKNEWAFVAFTISKDTAKVYINGEVVKAQKLSGPINWTGCDLLSIMSGAPRFTGWDHKSDASLMDELRTFNKALKKEEVKSLME